MQTEGYAVRQMPKYEIDNQKLDNVRTALQNSRKIIGTYNGKQRIIEPLGMIYGDKIYLIAREKKKGKDIYTYLLHKFEDIRVSLETFDKGDFDLQEYSNKSFGVYHGEILDVKLKFTPEAKAEAIRYNFHPTQKIKEEKDGSLTVTFKASGDKEIMWHVFKWGKDCRILEPKSLKNEYKKYLEDVLQVQ
jgi:predicted DNA-binding transcriptional regulator YafY